MTRVIVNGHVVHQDIEEQSIWKLIGQLVMALWSLAAWIFVLWYLIHSASAYDANPSAKNFQDMVLWILFLIFLKIGDSK
jgi:hypothetical protein